MAWSVDHLIKGSCMFSILILFILAWSFYIGYSRGILLQGYYFFTMVVAMLVAGSGYQSLAKTISLWIPFSSATQASKTYFYGADQLFHLDKVFYAGLAYFILFVLVYAMGRVIGLFIPLIPTPEKWEEYPFQIASGVLAVLVTYFVLQMGFTILSTIPMAAIQDRLHGSFLIRFMVQYSPLTAGLLKQLWVVKILGA